jgi:ATP-binding cassette subfamily B protein
LLPVASLLSTICQIVCISLGVLFIGRTLDALLTPGLSASVLLGLALTIFGARVGEHVCDFGRAITAETLGQRVERDARDELYVSLLGKSLTYHSYQNLGDLMARATNDVQQLSLMINPGISLMISSLLFIVVPLVATFAISAQLLLIPLLLIGGFVVALWSYGAELAPLSEALRSQFGVMNSSLSEAISGIEVVKVFAQERAEQQRFAGHAQRYSHLFVRQGKAQARYFPLLAYSVAFGLGFGHALILARQGSISAGDVVAFMGLLGILRLPTGLLLFTVPLAQLGMAGAGRILALISTETDLDENRDGYSQPIAGSISFQHVSVAFDGADILRDITFHAQPGETIAIVGQTGAGKTILTHLINRIYDVRAGSVCVDGVDVRDWSLHTLRSQIAMIEQDVFLFSRTIAENIAFGAHGEVSQQQIEQAARQAQIHDFIVGLEAGYATVVGERGVTLSGGQRQRIALARAFLTKSRILILDDATSAIDSATEDEIQRVLGSLRHTCTTILVTHRLSQIRWADRIVLLERGALLACGTHDQLMQQHAAYQRLFLQPASQAYLQQ